MSRAKPKGILVFCGEFVKSAKMADYVKNGKNKWSAVHSEII